MAPTRPTPLYEHRLANAGEYEMSEARRKIESTGGTCLALQALPDPVPKLAFLTDFLRHYSGALVPSLRVTVSTPLWEMSVM